MKYHVLDAQFTKTTPPNGTLQTHLTHFVANSPREIEPNNQHFRDSQYFKNASNIQHSHHPEVVKNNAHPATRPFAELKFSAFRMKYVTAWTVGSTDDKLSRLCQSANKTECAVPRPQLTLAVYSTFSCSSTVRVHSQAAAARDLIFQVRASCGRDSHHRCIIRITGEQKGGGNEGYNFGNGTIE